MGKSNNKKSSSQSVSKLRKRHVGPKKKLFHCWDSTMRLHLAKAGLLCKYTNKESWEQSCNAKGIRAEGDSLWKEFVALDLNSKKVWFKNHTKN